MDTDPATMTDWQTEIAELHAFFEAYFLGALPDDLYRVDAALAPAFVMAGPDGNESSREQVMASLKAGYRHTSSLKITTSEYRLVHDSDTVVIAAYTESHQLSDRSNHRRATVVFLRDPQGPNGLCWLRVHETWIDRGI